MTAQSINMDLARITERISNPDGKIVMGIDGYKDSVWQILKSRTDNNDLVLYEKMSHFSQTLAGFEEGGFSNEIILKRNSPGGFTANTSKAILALEANILMLGMFGKNSIDPVFEFFEKSGDVISVGDPGLVTIYEFTDGKIMLVYLEEVMGFNWQSMMEAIDEDKLKSIYMDADIIGLGYWSLMPAFEEIVTKICELIKDNPKKQRMFFDFADIQKKERSSLESTLVMLSELNKQVPMTLSLNEHEAALMYSYYGETMAQEAEGADTQCEKVRSIIGLDELVVHTPYFAVAASVSEGSCVVKQNYCASPIITVGAGDHFNRGYMTAALKGLSIEERLTVGNAVTYLFLSRGKAPTKEELLEELAKNYI